MSISAPTPCLIVPTLCVVTPPVTLRVTADAERPWLHSHAERGNDQVRNSQFTDVKKTCLQ
ncbi:hypothetical protein CQ009_23460 [Pseudomonas sp. MYb2]|nr:hypothetical protein CQ025_24155 [Pseudomonas sp. MYb3]PRC30303.1 hypothetical protein CQ009_23460 [Pseudomonas sp. MYb2]